MSSPSDADSDWAALLGRGTNRGGAEEQMPPTAALLTLAVASALSLAAYLTFSGAVRSFFLRASTLLGRLLEVLG